MDKVTTPHKRKRQLGVGGRSPGAVFEGGVAGSYGGGGAGDSNAGGGRRAGTITLGAPRVQGALPRARLPAHR